MNRLILSSSYQIRQSLMTQCRSISTSLQLVPKNRKVCFVYGYYGKEYALFLFRTHWNSLAITEISSTSTNQLWRTLSQMQFIWLDFIETQMHGLRVE